MELGAIIYTDIHMCIRCCPAKHAQAQMKITIDTTYEEKKTIFSTIIEIIQSIPFGSVATYGQIAHMAGTRDARLVGYALASNHPHGDPIPWHRVVSKDGKISLKDKPKYLTQKKLLLSEGIIFGEDEAIDLKKKGWLTSDRKDRP